MTFGLCSLQNLFVVAKTWKNPALSLAVYVAVYLM